MPRKETKASGSGKRNWLGHLLLYAVLIIVGYQAFVLVFGSGALSLAGINSGNIPLFDQLGGVATHSGVSGTVGGVGKVSGFPLNNEGYEKLLEADRTIVLTDEEKKQFAGFDTRLPCCGFGITSEDEENDCRCGHHVADAGLIKIGIKKGASREDIQAELDAWKPIFYPICGQQPELCDANGDGR